LPQESGKVVAQSCPAQARDAQRKNALRACVIWILLKTHLRTLQLRPGYIVRLVVANYQGSTKVVDDKSLLHSKPLNERYRN
jgi:hypothetical protein